MKQSARPAKTVYRKAGFMKTFRKNLPLTIMALPALVVLCVLWGGFLQQDMVEISLVGSGFSAFLYYRF